MKIYQLLLVSILTLSQTSNAAFFRATFTRIKTTKGLCHHINETTKKYAPETTIILLSAIAGAATSCGIQIHPQSITVDDPRKLQPPITLSDIDPKKFPNLVRFMKRYGNLPPDAQEALQNHTTLSDTTRMTNCASRVFKIKTPNKDYYFKKDDSQRPITRIINAHRIERCIEEHGLQHVGVPKKYFVLRDNEWAVLAEGIESSDCFLTLEQVEDLVIVVEKTGIADLHNENIKTQGSKVFIIDTGLAETKKSSAVGSFLGLFPWYTKSPDADHFLTNLSEKKNKQEESLLARMWNMLGYDTINTKKYDDKDIDYEQVNRDMKKVLEWWNQEWQVPGWKYEKSKSEEEDDDDEN